MPGAQQPQQQSAPEAGAQSSSDSSRHLKSRHAPADPASPDDSNQQDSDKTAQLARQAASKQVLQKLVDKYSDVHKVPIDGSMFPFEGNCLRCGWHTLELSEDAAKKNVEAHIAQHWRDAVVGIQLQGGSGPLGLEGAAADLRREAMLAQEKGAQKGGQDALKPIEQKQKQRDQQMTQLAMQFTGTGSSSHS